MYEDGTSVLERECYHSEKSRRMMATSWPDIDRKKLVKLDLYWHGLKKATISKEEHPSIGPDDWFFSQTGYMDMRKRSVSVIKRNMGYRHTDGLLYVTSVFESNGTIQGSVRV
jgi:hypothetical protein